MSYIIGNKCVGVKDGVCMEVCPVECITETDEMMLINPEECIDCGMCLACPVDAIFTDEEEAIEAEGIEIVNKNYNFFNLKYGN